MTSETEDHFSEKYSRTSDALGMQAALHAGRKSFAYALALDMQGDTHDAAQHQVVKPNELASALMRPLQTSVYEPHRSPAYLAATLSYGIIQGPHLTRHDA